MKIHPYVRGIRNWIFHPVKRWVLALGTLGLVLLGLLVGILITRYDLTTLTPRFARGHVALEIDGTAYSVETVLAFVRSLLPTEVIRQERYHDTELIALHLEDFLLVELIKKEFRTGTRGVAPSDLEAHVLYQILPPEPQMRREALGIIAVNYAFLQQNATAFQVTQQDIERYYQEHLDEFRREDRIVLAQIVFDTAEKAQQVYHQIQISPEVFDYYARLGQQTEAASHRMGLFPGNVGVLEKRYLPDFLKQHLANLDVGQVSPPIAVGDRFVIYKLLERRPAGVAPLEEVADSIRLKIIDQRLNDMIPKWLQRLFQKHRVRIHWNSLGIKPDQVLWRWTPASVVNALRPEARS